MTDWYLAFVQLIIGTAMTSIGFKLYKPKFRSEESEKEFYKRYKRSFQYGGLALIAMSYFTLKGI